MTTKFDSFDSSELGTFVESPLGVRNRLMPLTILLFIAIDEASPYTDTPNPETGPQWYRDDVDEYNSFVNVLRVVHGIHVKNIVMQPLDSEEFTDLDLNALVPAGESHSIFNFFLAFRPGSVSQYITALDTILNEAAGVRFSERDVLIVLAIDDSGSVTRADIEPTISNFISLIEEGVAYPRVTIDDRGSLRPIFEDGGVAQNERWVLAFTTMLRETDIRP